MSILQRGSSEALDSAVCRHALGIKESVYYLKIASLQNQQEKKFRIHVRVVYASHSSPALLILCPLYSQMASAESEGFTIRFLLTMKVPNSSREPGFPAGKLK